MGAAVGLAVLGQCRLDNHLAALEGLEGTRLVGCSLEEKASDCGLPQELLLGDHAEAVNHSDVQAVIVCTSLPQRNYWIIQAAASGKHVFSESPFAATFSQASEVVNSCSSAGIELAVRARHLSSALDMEIRRLLEEQTIGPLLFFDLKVSALSQCLRNKKEGVLLLHGLEYLSFIGRHLGPLDSLYAHTRSLGLNRPAEDIAVAQLWFKNGLEGIVQINGLGEQNEVSLRVYGRHGTMKSNNGWGENLDGLRLQYEDFIECISHGRRPVWSGEKALEGLYWAHWIHQAARLGREIARPEVKIS